MYSSEIKILIDDVKDHNNIIECLKSIKSRKLIKLNIREGKNGIVFKEYNKLIYRSSLKDISSCVRGNNF